MIPEKKKKTLTYYQTNYTYNVSNLIFLEEEKKNMTKTLMKNLEMNFFGPEFGNEIDSVLS